MLFSSAAQVSLQIVMEFPGNCVVSSFNPDTVPQLIWHELRMSTVFHVRGFSKNDWQSGDVLPAGYGRQGQVTECLQLEVSEQASRICGGQRQSTVLWRCQKRAPKRRCARELPTACVDDDSCPRGPDVVPCTFEMCDVRYLQLPDASRERG